MEPTCDCGECRKCKHRLYMRDWYRRPGRAETVRERVNRYRSEHIEEVRAYDRARSHRTYDKAKERARMAVTHAVEKGVLVREPCERCGADPINDMGLSLVHAHHPDYSKPLDVVWLCSACHGIEHRIVA